MISRLHELLCEIFNQETIPKEWNQGIIFYFWKQERAQTECSNYRGIALLSAVAKVLAWILLT